PLPPLPQPLVVREYAHVRSEPQGGSRRDFAETVYWNPVAIFDTDGRATASFNLSDSVTSFRILVAAHTLDGRLGQSTQRIEVRKPFAVETKLPAEISSNDRLELPIQVRNDSEGDRAAVLTVHADGFRMNGSTDRRDFTDRLVLSPNQAVRRLLSLQPAAVEGHGLIKVHGSSEPFSADTLERSIRIVPDGFPVVESVSDVFSPGDGPKVVLRDVELPADCVPGTLRLFARLFPSPLADLQQGLESMLQEPMGCFEQSSSGNYPNTLIMSYLKERGESNLPAMQRAAELLDRGYERLISFECRKPSGGREGYEWFGGDAPPHEALTAYGLLQFNDMAGVYPVDKAMLTRTRNYLLSRRKPDGGFLRNERALDSFGRAPQHITDAYIVWSLAATGDEDLSRDIDKLLQEPEGQNDPYFLSLLANALLHRGQKDQAVELLRKVKTMQADDGGIDGARTSITSSGGRDLRIETTALAILAWLKVDRPEEFQEPTSRAIRWMTQQRGGFGGFGATQATILALKALLEFTKSSKRIADDGELKLFAGDRLVGQVRFLADRTEPVTLEVEPKDDIIKPGKTSLRLELHSKAGLPYSLAWSYYRRVPSSSDKCTVRLTTSLDRAEVQEGDGVRLRARLENVSGKGLPMTVAIIGLPAGLRVPEDMRQLRELARLRRGEGDQILPGEISFFEIRGRELVLYWRDVKPEAVIDLNIDLRADHPGEFRGPASRAYLYYDAEHKNWVEPLFIRIQPKSP
ncbi:MAG: alpha-2-macroglobulin, partial [Gemmataceae bacterium]|nr:alpha-2-macroglobulin [Gemmataceae bacterium]